ncbi:uncharacterized protein LOC122529828 isoform X2 [Frieseomelitta varia]|uniref:uncharacterized protein LOC122529828 isoform X2 n=1 Tax=Frieseomelitta varia TaxID=561572 RepID=UPI001CB69D52|nr:uncharacterized protein LOC122529828 isoform X2 [Frieseomelitta varia]
MPVAWTDSLTLRLVTFYSKHECLRNPFHPDYKNKQCRYKAYKQIVNSMNVCGLTIYDCIKRVTSVKAQYCYELSKISAAISCEKFYRPTTSWFPIVHELFFPFVPIYNCASDCYKTYGDRTDTYENYNETQDPSTRSFFVEQRVLSTDCDCPHATCYCDKLNVVKSRLRKSERLSSSRAEGEGIVTLQSTTLDCKDYAHPQRVSRVDVGSSTKKGISVEQATQSEISYFKTACAACQVCVENELPRNLTRNDLVEANASCTDCVLPEENIKGKRKVDEFDMFGRSIAFQLRNVNFEIFVIEIFVRTAKKKKNAVQME